MSGRVSNYELTKRRMAQKFLEYDQEEMIRRFRLDSGEDWIGRRYCVCVGGRRAGGGWV